MKVKTIIVNIVVFIIAFAIGYFVRSVKNNNKEVVIKQKEIKYNVIARNVEYIECEELRKELNCYYTAIPKLDIMLNAYKDNTAYISAQAQLCEREWTREAAIQIKQDNNYTYYVAIGAICIAGGVLIANLVK